MEKKCLKGLHGLEMEFKWNIFHVNYKGNMENQSIVCINIFVEQFINACSLYIFVNVIYCNETIVCHKYSQFIHGQKMPVFASVSIWFRMSSSSQQ